LNLRNLPTTVGSKILKVAYQGDILKVSTAPQQNGFLRLIDGSWAAAMYLRPV
jgi:hypothetical protein